MKQKSEPQIRLPEIWIKDDRYAFANLCDMIQRYTTQQDFGFSVVTTADNTNDSIGKSMMNNDILIIHFGDRTFYVPTYLYTFSKNYVIKKIQKISKKFSKKRRLNALQDYMDTLPMYVSLDSRQKIILLIYKNMSPKRRLTEIGKNIKKSLDSMSIYSIEKYICLNETGTVKDLLDIYNVKYSYLKTVFDKICQNNTISTEMRALIMDEMEKKRKEEISESDNMYDI